MKAPTFWFFARPTPAARALRPLSALYGALAARRMARPGQRVAARVVAIGNFVAGGAGKTPTARALARLLQADGAHVAFLSRGYGGRVGAGPARATGADASLFGDEPLLLAESAPTYVGADRVGAARRAIAEGADALVLDDGLQSRRIEPDLAIAVVDGASGVGNGLCLPAGPLRAPLAAQLAHVDALIVIGAGAAGEAVAAAAQPKPVFRARLAPHDSARALCGRRTVAVAGIGRPEKFFATLAGIGADVVARHAFADHHAYTGADIAPIARAAAEAGAVLATTEKDAVRWPADAPRPFVVRVDLAFDDPAAVRDFVAAHTARRAD